MRKVLLAAATIALFLLPACSKDQPATPAKMSRVSATGAFEKYFGAAPTTDKGTCYAFVIYFPSAKEAGKVLPLPFFTFDQGTIKKVALERLMAGMDVPAYAGEVAEPFAPGTRLLGISDDKGIVKVDLSKDFLKSGADAAGTVHALVLTLSQFEGVKGVSLLTEGKPLESAPAVLLGDQSWALQPGPPRLLGVTAMKEKGASGVNEVDAYFDRPVEIASLVMTDKSGTPFAGTTYQSVFDMAAVLKPKDPAVFVEKMPVRVRWNVTDKMGRHAEGNDMKPLEVREH